MSIRSKTTFLSRLYEAKAKILKKIRVEYEQDFKTVQRAEKNYVAHVMRAVA